MIEQLTIVKATSCEGISRLHY